MSDNTNQKDISSFFEKQQAKKQTQQRQQTKKQEKSALEQKKLQEEQKNAKAGAEFESDEEEDIQGGLEIGTGKVKDIKEVNKKKTEQQHANQANNFWESLTGDKKQAQAAAQVKPEEKKSVASQGAKTVGEINFKGKPQFHKPKTVANKQEFPELGQALPQQKAPQTQSQPQPTVTVQAKEPVKPTFKKQENKFQNLQEQEGIQRQSVPAPVPATVPVQEVKPEPVKPKFSGSVFKNILQKQQEENAEANKNLPELQEKLKEQIKIHEAKKPRQTQEEGHSATAATHDNDDEFEGEVVEEKKRDQGNRRGGRGTGRGGRGGRGGFQRDGEEHQHNDHREGEENDEENKNSDFKKGQRPDRPPREERPYNKEFKDFKGEKKQHKNKNVEPSEETHKAVPIKQQDIIIANKPKVEVKFDGWGNGAFF